MMLWGGVQSTGVNGNGLQAIPEPAAATLIIGAGLALLAGKRIFYK